MILTKVNIKPLKWVSLHRNISVKIETISSHCSKWYLVQYFLSEALFLIKHIAFTIPLFVSPSRAIKTVKVDFFNNKILLLRTQSVHSCNFYQLFSSVGCKINFLKQKFELMQMLYRITINIIILEIGI